MMKSKGEGGGTKDDKKQAQRNRKKKAHKTESYGTKKQQVWKWEHKRKPLKKNLKAERKKWKEITKSFQERKDPVDFS